MLSANLLAQVPGVMAKSYIVTDLDGSVILEHDAKTVRPIASITKLLVAEQISKEIAPADLVTIEKADIVSRSSIIKIHSKIQESELLQLALISSSNQAIYALARVHDEPKIVLAVNDAARARGLNTIYIEEPSGLNQNNRASAEDLAKFLRMVDGTPIAQVSTEPTAKILNSSIHSTNPLLGKPGWNFSVSKTGFINASGGCIATIVEIGGKPRAVVILGSSNTTTRWIDLMLIRTYIASSDIFWKNSSKAKHEHHHHG